MQEIQFKLDPGSKTTGLALVANFKRGKRCIWAGELTLTHQDKHPSIKICNVEGSFLRLVLRPNCLKDSSNRRIQV